MRNRRALIRHGLIALALLCWPVGAALAAWTPGTAQASRGDAATDVRNVRLRAQEVGEDTVQFRLQWTAPQRAARNSEITGYEWQLGQSADSVLDLDGEWDVQLTSGTYSGAQARIVVIIRWPIDCESELTWYGARVRAIGTWPADSVAAWGNAQPVQVERECPASPPGPPGVDPLDTVSVPPPDSDELVVMSTSEYLTELEPGQLHATALGQNLTLCQYHWRDGQRLRAGWETGVVLEPGPLHTAIPLEGEQACWEVWLAEEPGSPILLVSALPGS